MLYILHDESWIIAGLWKLKTFKSICSFHVSWSHNRHETSENRTEIFDKLVRNLRMMLQVGEDILQRGGLTIMIFTGDRR